jgi:hypothetical protein
MMDSTIIFKSLKLLTRKLGTEATVKEAPAVGTGPDLALGAARVDITPI